MTLARLNCMYGHLEGIDGKFARDITGYLSIDAGIYQKHGLEVSWNHVQGTEERYRRLESGEAQISFVVGRASLQHFLDTKATRVIGCAMNSCPYLLIGQSRFKEIKDLKGQVVVCREGPGRGVPFRSVFQQASGLTMGEDFQLNFVGSDQEAFHMLLDGKVAAALVPRPYGFVAEEKGFVRMTGWPDIVDDPLPITIETTARIAQERAADLKTFLAAHREGIVYAKANRQKVIELLISKFGHWPMLAEKTFTEYLGYMDESLTVDVKELTKLLAQVDLSAKLDARQVAAEWLMAGALRP